MTYTPNVPLANQQIAATQGPILGNFQYIDTAMKINHTWNGNAIAGEAPGSHQDLNMPNQPMDITGALPTGIAAIMYAIAGSLYTWDGTNKNPVSGVSKSGTVNLITGNTTVFTIPNNCIGFAQLEIQNWSLFPPGTPSVATGIVFSNINQIPEVTSIGVVNVTFPVMTIIVNNMGKGNTITAINSGAPKMNVPYKFIYWPI